MSISTRKTVCDGMCSRFEQDLLELGLIHFCWRGREDPLDEPELDLVMVPTDGSFVTYDMSTVPQPSAKTSGRLFVLKFASSSQRYLFWMQSKPQATNGDPTWFSPRDRKIGDIVHRLLQGEDVHVNRELAAVRNVDNRRDDDEDEQMEDADSQRNTHNRQAGRSGGAGADATGNSAREEGQGSREGGGDGARG